MEINILTSTTREKAYEPSVISEHDFWEYYLMMLELRSATHLTSRERRLMIEVLSSVDCHVRSYFSGDDARTIREKLKITAPEMSRMKSSLTAKGFLTKGDQKGEAWPTKALTGLKRYIGSNQDITFIFPFHVTENR